MAQICVAYGLTGGGAGSLDAINCTGANAIVDGDFCIVVD